MEINKLIEWNSWWENNQSIDRLIGFNREKYSVLLNSINIKEVTIITGIRRSGKSTLIYQMIHNLLKNNVDPNQILLVNLEDKKLLDDSLEDIYSCYRQNINLNKKAYIFLDEIHRKEDWAFWIRKKYDLKTNDKFIITSSCSYLLRKEYSTLLTGRNLMFEVFPLSFKEYLLFKKVDINKENLKKSLITSKTKLAILKYFDEYLKLGGFPEVFFKIKEFKIKILEQYFDDILYKDIIDRYDINTQKAKDLALFLMTNFTKPFSLRSIRGSLKISYDTIKDYISYFKDAFLFFTLDQFSFSLKQQKILPSKIYVIDNGLRNSVSFKFSEDFGRLVENLVFIELKRRKKDVYYWLDRGEVDFVIKNNNQTLIAINVTYSDSINKREIKSLLEFKNKFGSCKLIILTKTLEKKEQEIQFIPVWKWLLE